MSSEASAKSPSSTSRELTIAASGVLIILSTIYALLAFANFSPPTILGAMLLFTAPVALVAIGTSIRGVSRLKPFLLRDFIYGLPLGLSLFMAPLVGLRAWFDNRYVVNLPSYALEGGRGIHHDTAFHVTLIQGILDFGYPTTSQHLNPVTPYHAVAHYFDAGISLILGTDPWETYALFFYAKSVALILAILVSIYAVGKRLPVGLFLALLFVTVVGVTHGWGVSGSHSQWLAVFGLVLFAPATYRWILYGGSRWASLAGLTILFMLLMPTKVTTALGFAIFAGLSLFLMDFRARRIWALGALWVGMFVSFFVLTDGFGNTSQEEPSRVAVFDSSYGVAFSSISLGILLLILAGSSHNAGLKAFGTAGIVGPLVLATVIFSQGAIATGDTHQFFVGFFYSQLCVSVEAIASFLEEWTAESEALGRLFPATLVGCLLLTVSPLWLGPNSGYWTPADVARSVISTNTVTYETVNSVLPREERLSVFRQFSGQSRMDIARAPEDLISSLDRAVVDVLQDNDWAKKDVYFLIPEESYSHIEDTHAIRSWMTSLLVKAETGVSLVHSLDAPPPHGPGTYGMNAYSDVAQRIPAGSINPRNLCLFDKPVILAEFADQWQTKVVLCQ